MSIMDLERKTKPKTMNEKITIIAWLVGLVCATYLLWESSGPYPYKSLQIKPVEIDIIHRNPHLINADFIFKLENGTTWKGWGWSELGSNLTEYQLYNITYLEYQVGNFITNISPIFSRKEDEI